MFLAELTQLRSGDAVQWSPDGTRIAYTITSNDAPGGPYSQLWLLNVASGQFVRVGDAASRGSQPLWAPDGKSLAYVGSIGGKMGLIICAADGSVPAWKAEMLGTNSSALTNTAKTLAWSPDAKTWPMWAPCLGQKRPTRRAIRFSSHGFSTSQH